MDQFNSTEAIFNFSSSPGLPPQPNWYTRRLVPAVVLSICFILGVPGNIAVILLRPNWQHLSSLSQSLMLNLAASDLLCLMTLPLWIYALLNDWTFGLVVCKLLAFIVLFSTYGSMLTVTGLSVQRYLVVVHQKSFHQVRIKLLLVLLWLVSFILSIPALVLRELARHQKGTDCRFQYSDAQRVSVLMTEVLVGFVSFSIVVFSYIRLQKKISQDAFFNNPQTSRLITSIIVSFSLLWLPYFLTNILGVAADGLKHETLLKFHLHARNIAVAVTFVNRCLNPLLYAFSFCRFCTKREAVQSNQRTPPTADMSTIVEHS